MAAPIIEYAIPALPILLAALALVGGGVALIASAQRTRDETLARRVAMVEPDMAVAEREIEHRRAEEALVRVPAGEVEESSQREIIRLMSPFHLAPGQALKVFTGIRLAIVIMLGAITLIWAQEFAAVAANPLLPPALAIVAAIAGWFVPMMFVAHRVKQRAEQVRSGLPDALELLVVCVEAGLSLEDGFARVVSELKRSQPTLADELALTLADLKILPSRDQALANLAKRVDVPTVRAVVTTLAQTLRYGTPLVQALRVTAAELRNDYLIEMEERANRLPAYLTLPVIVFLMPTIFLIVGGPAALRLIDVFTHR